ncbi:hypothetical protein EGY07_06105 [Chryseobacterium indologenes]|uniref:helix-turn-helix transcriptional regulator n=1 Tax=Chryseobacterium TaxID=59732 RepID=UPI000EC66B83|nr:MULTISPECIES: hypothetical protein [Chryseobacterium]AYZ35173.1 hypothetical protein EGY07_06105 [Chryseobacterium indologenes]UEQ78080.1 hypothetical protein J8N07_07205 [Chryseobacterium arthrosphaerae]VXC32452.1 conserved hypothetical protein [Chryseobacterium sp. 8AT]HCR76289.1 hypothetical protein [Chryseobacterium sp.]
MEYKEKIRELLQEGYSSKEISDYLKENKFKTCSISSVTNYIAKLKKEYNAKTRFELSVLLMR